MDINVFLIEYNNFYEEDIIKNIKLHIGYNILVNFVEHNNNDFEEKDVIKHIENNKEYYYLLADKFLSIYGDMFNQINELVYIMLLYICDCLVDIKKINPNINDNITMDELNKEIYSMLNVLLIIYELNIDKEENYLYIPEKIFNPDKTDEFLWNDIKINFFDNYNKQQILNNIKKYYKLIIKTSKIDSKEYNLNEELIYSLITYNICKNINKYIIKGG
jgi:hypothetical protein